MTDPEQSSKDVVFGLFDIAASCVDFAHGDPQEALDKFNAEVNKYITFGGRLTG